MEQQGEMGRWSVHVYEPGVDPGGYEGEFTVEAETQALAEARAIRRAWEAWPKAGFLTVWRTAPIGSTGS